MQFERLYHELSAHVPTTFLVVPRHGPRGRFLPVKEPADLVEVQPRLREMLGDSPGGRGRRSPRRQNAPLNREASPADTQGMEAVRDFRSQWPALGKLLIRDGALTTEQLEHALSLQRLKPGLRLGQVIVEQGYATSLDISRSVAEQHELEFVELELKLDRRRGRDDASRESRPSLPGAADPPQRRRVDPGGGRGSHECRLRRRASPGDRDARATVRRGTRVHRGGDRSHLSGCRGA